MVFVAEFASLSDAGVSRAGRIIALLCPSPTARRTFGHPCPWTMAAVIHQVRKQ